MAHLTSLPRKPVPRSLRLLLGVLLLAGGLCAALLVFTAPEAMAQVGSTGELNEIAFPTLRSFGTGSDTTVAVAVGDMDGDGDLDIVAGNENELGMISFNDGLGHFPEPEQRLFGEARDTDSLALGDLDGDGDLDIVASNGDGSVQVYLNNGKGEVSEGVTVLAPVGAGNPTQLALGDMNGDGFFDIVLARANGEALLLVNDGSAHFPVTKTLGTESTNAHRIALGDLDGNGLLDVVLARSTGKATLLSRMPNGADYSFQARMLDVNGDQIQAIVLADFSGNGRLDILVSAPSDRPLIYFENLADQDFEEVIYPLRDQLRSVSRRLVEELDTFNGDNGDAWSVAAGDLNGDGTLDLLVGLKLKSWLNRVLINQANGTFDDWSKITFGSKELQAAAVALADLNGDGFLDIVSAVRGSQNGVYLNAGKLELELARRDLTDSIPGNKEITALALGDVNNDGRLDIVTGRQPSLFIQLDDTSFDPQVIDQATDAFAIDLADFDGDGWLDLIAGNDDSNRAIYFNDQAGHFPLSRRHVITSIRSSTSGHLPDYKDTSLAIGDLDREPGMDLILCSVNAGCDLHLNKEATGRFSADQALHLGTSGIDYKAAAVAVGDLNHDGSLDIVIGSMGGWNQIFLNDGRGKFPSHLNSQFGTGVDWTRSVAIADINGDSFPDILTGNFYELGTIYFNDGRGNFSPDRIHRFGSSSDRVYSIAVGDVNGDGAVDFATAHWGSVTDPNLGVHNALYLNDGSGNFSAMPLGGLHWTRAIAFGDMDGNGTLDIVDGNRYVEYKRDGNIIPSAKWVAYLSTYLNRLRTSLLQANNPITIVLTQTDSVDGVSIPLEMRLTDRESDLVGRVDFRYSLDGGGSWTEFQPANLPSREPLQTSPNGHVYRFQFNPIALGVFGRSDNAVVQVRAYSPPVNTTATSSYRYTNSVPSLGQWPFVAATTAPFTIEGMSVRVSQIAPQAGAVVYHQRDGQGKEALPIGGVEEPFETDANGFLPGRRQLSARDKLIALAPSAWLPIHMPPRRYASFDEFPVTSTIANRAISHVKVPDARPIVSVRGWADISSTGPLSIALHLTTPWRERLLLDYSVRTHAYDAQKSQATFTPTLSLPANARSDGDWSLELSTPFSTPVALQGWGLEFQLSPLYFTSARPGVTGLESHAITPEREQQLYVLESNPLLLFDLNVALEWDARSDDEYMSRLRGDIRRASEMLYDWTDSQVALGNVRIYHDARHNRLPDGTDAWNNAHIRIFATNRLRPNADQGGFITEVLTETVHLPKGEQTNTYAPGQVRMGASWNRMGSAQDSSLGEDWAAAFAHELGHYLLFLDDNYLGFNDANLPVPLTDEACPGAMNNPYSAAYSEFQPMEWTNEECERTLSAQHSGRSDWQTISRFYGPWLRGPSVLSETNPGPALLPLAVTQVSEHSPMPRQDLSDWLAQQLDLSAVDMPLRLGEDCRTGNEFLGLSLAQKVLAQESEGKGCPGGESEGTTLLDVPIFYLKYHESEQKSTPYRASDQARAFLFRGPPYRAIIDLGTPGRDQLLARGARLGDWLCVHDLPQGYVGCQKIASGDDQLEMISAPGWAPEMAITPVTSRTLQVSLSLPKLEVNQNLALSARLYPTNQPAFPFVTLEETPLDADSDRIVYRAQLITDEPVLDGYVWVGNDAQDGRRAVTEFAVGGNPTPGLELHSGSNRSVRILGLGAPVAAPDGQVIVYPDETLLQPEQEWSFILQPATRLPQEIPWMTQVGRAYWLAASSTITEYGKSSISFRYLDADVLPGEEGFIHLYFWDENHCTTGGLSCWRLVPEQKLYTEPNLLAAPLQGAGFYALFSSSEIALEPGWNAIGYPILGKRSIAEALASIDGYYDIVYGYAAGRSDDPWSAFAPDIQQGPDELSEMSFGNGYLIHMTKAGTLQLRGSGAITEYSALPVASPILRSPPALYFGAITSRVNDFTPQSGMTVTAKIGDTLCGQGKVVDDSGGYVIKVRAAASGDESCGAHGRQVTFGVDDREAETGTPVFWENEGPQELLLQVSAEEPTAQPTPTPNASAPTPIPSITATPQPEPPPVAHHCREQVRNGSFDTQGEWVRPLTDSQAQIVENADITGRGYLLIGSRTPLYLLSYSTAYQDILIPAGISSAKLSFSYQTDPQAEASGRFVQIQQLDAAPLLTTYLSGSQGWRSFEIDLTAHQGSWVRIFFQATNSASSGARWMSIDKVSVQTCNPP